MDRPRKHIAQEFGVTAAAVCRHWRLHVGPAEKADCIAGKRAMADLAAKSRAEDRSLLDYLAMLRSALMRLFMDAQKHGKTYDAALVSARLLNVLEMTGRLNGELREHADAIGATVNILNAPGGVPTNLHEQELARVQAAVIRALRPFPEARAAVVAALDELATDSPAIAAAPNGAPADHPLLIEHEAAP
jgi:hypothetical protein